MNLSEFNRIIESGLYIQSEEQIEQLSQQINASSFDTDRYKVMMAFLREVEKDLHYLGVEYMRAGTTISGLKINPIKYPIKRLVKAFTSRGWILKAKPQTPDKVYILTKFNEDIALVKGLRALPKNKQDYENALNNLPSTRTEDTIFVIPHSFYGYGGRFGKDRGFNPLVTASSVNNMQRSQREQEESDYIGKKFAALTNHPRFKQLNDQLLKEKFEPQNSIRTASVEWSFVDQTSRRSSIKLELKTKLRYFSIGIEAYAHIKDLGVLKTRSQADAGEGEFSYDLSSIEVPDGVVLSSFDAAVNKATFIKESIISNILKLENR